MKKRVGSWVRLKNPEREGPQKARIRSEHPDFARGAVYLDRPLGGFFGWYKSDLIATTKPKGSS